MVEQYDEKGLELGLFDKDFFGGIKSAFKNVTKL